MGRSRAATPLITTLPYVYEAFREVYALDKDERWRAVMRSTAEHALLDYRDIEIAPGVATLHLYAVVDRSGRSDQRQRLPCRDALHDGGA